MKNLNLTQQRLFRYVFSVVAVFLVFGSMNHSKAQKMAAHFGEIRMFAGTTPPRGWEFCRGQLLNIDANRDLFSVLGTAYGGDGINTFALPDLRGRFPIGTGTPESDSTVTLGEAGGNSQVVLDVLNLPSHNHSIRVNRMIEGDTDDPSGAVIATGMTPDLYKIKSFTRNEPDAELASAAVTHTGSNAPINVKNPYLGINFIICVEEVVIDRGISPM